MTFKRKIKRFKKNVRAEIRGLKKEFKSELKELGQKVGMAKQEIKKEVEENIYNIPNLLSAFRIFAAVLLVYLIFADYSRLLILCIFIAAALTDGIDGELARRFNQRTRFGKLFDPISDRILMCSVVVALLANAMVTKQPANYYLFLPFVLSRELISLPAFFFLKKGDVHFNVKPIGKATTFLQSITIPAFLLNFIFVPALIVLTCIVGILSGITYFNDCLKENDRTSRRQA